MARGVVGITDGDELGPVRYSDVQIVEIHSPIKFFPKVEFPHTKPEIVCNTPNLQVVGQHDDNFVARFQQRPERSEVGLGGTTRDKHVVRRSSRVEIGNVFSQFQDAICLWVVKSC